MKKSVILFLFVCLGSVCFGQSNTGPRQILPVISQSNSDLPEIIKGEIDEAMDTDQLIEMLLSGLVYSRVGELHSTILDNPEVLGLAIKANQAIQDLFIDYVTTDNIAIRNNAETQLIDLY